MSRDKLRLFLTWFAITLFHSFISEKTQLTVRKSIQLFQSCTRINFNQGPPSHRFDWIMQKISGAYKDGRKNWSFIVGENGELFRENCQLLFKTLFRSMVLQLMLSDLALLSTENDIAGSSLDFSEVDHLFWSQWRLVKCCNLQSTPTLNREHVLSGTWRLHC